MDNVVMFLLLSFGGMTGFLALAGIYEYVLCPVWEMWKERKIRG